MTDVGNTPVEPSEFVARSPERPVSLNWPAAVDAHLELLLDRADAAGERTSRKELVAAIIADTDLDGSALGQLLRTFRTKRVRDLLPQPTGSDVIKISARKPGPRRRR